MMTEANQDTDRYAGLIGRVGRGDQGALEALYNETRRPVESTVHRIVGDWHAAEEVASEVYLQIWKKARVFNPARGTPLSWVLTIARHRAIDHIRAGKRTKEKESELQESWVAVTGDDPEKDSCRVEISNRIQAALQELSSAQREAIETIYFDGLSHREAARRLNLPLGTIKTRIRLALARMRNQLRPLRVSVA